MLWAHGFNFSEATECCRRAFAADPTCAMARWGEALCMGPNYNDPVLDDQRAASALQAAQDAVRLLDASSAAALAAVGDTSAALVRALPARLGPPTTSREEQDAAYAIAMAAVYESYGDSDADVAFAYADALMQLNPWRLWTGADTAIIEGDFECQRPSDDNTTRLIAVLEKGLTLAPRHAGLCHLYVHALEMGPRSLLRGAQLEAARDCIRDGVIPDSGHLIHMASHIDVQLGEYERTIRCNMEAVQADLKFKARAGVAAHSPGVSTDGGGPAMYDVYCAHNYHFVIYGAMFSGTSSRSRTRFVFGPRKPKVDLLRLRCACTVQFKITSGRLVCVRQGSTRSRSSLHWSFARSFRCFPPAQVSLTG